MTELAGLLAETAERLFARHCTPEVVTSAEREGWSPALWSEIEKAELARVGVPEAKGGAGGGLAEAAAVARVAARYAAPVPLGETGILAGHVLTSAGIQVPAGPLSAAVVHGGLAARVPYGRFATQVAVLVDDGSGVLKVGLARPTKVLEKGVNLAGEPRDRLAFEDLPELVPAPPGLHRRLLSRRGALLRAVQMAGALERVLELSVGYAAARQQFGTALNRFQAVQQMLALLAAEVIAAGAAVDAAVESPTWPAVAAAKIRAGEAAGTAAAIAHQVHGAIGFTDEHQLHHFTRRLWAWRDEFGAEADWAPRLGSMVASAGPGRLWPDLVAPPVQAPRGRK